MQPVSIVSTVLNEVEDIERSVSGLLAQEPSATEVIVVDGGSVDGTWEWLAAMQQRDPRLVAIRDETCSLKYSPGPISRGRNVAITAARASLIATADAGCAYDKDWLANLTAPLVAGTAEYALGGSCLDPHNHTIWDVASAPFFGIKLGRDEPTKSCTARSMAFTKTLWERIGGFPEAVLNGEDTLFDFGARRLTTPAFIANAKAIYYPCNGFRAACRQMARYAVSDGIARIRMARLFRNAARCVLELLALASLRWTVVPLLVVVALESWYAYHRDLRAVLHFGPRAVCARFVFSVAVPWIVAVNHIKGLFTSEQLTNWQNKGS